jgi:hypothetical protein
MKKLMNFPSAYGISRRRNKLLIASLQIKSVCPHLLQLLIIGNPDIGQLRAIEEPAKIFTPFSVSYVSFSK